MAPDGRDRKIYGIGGRLFGVKRVWPLRTYSDKLGEPFELSSDLRRIALHCGRAFGVDLFGLDVVISGGRPYVVDVQSFGSHMGVPDAPGSWPTTSTLRDGACSRRAAAARAFRGHACAFFLGLPKREEQ